MRYDWVCGRSATSYTDPVTARRTRTSDSVGVASADPCLRRPCSLGIKLDIQNYHFLLTFEGRRCFAPGAETARRVLDVGTGTGIWAIEFGKGSLYAILDLPLLTMAASG